MGMIPPIIPTEGPPNACGASAHFRSRRSAPYAEAQGPARARRRPLELFNRMVLVTRRSERLWATVWG